MSPLFSDLADCDRGGYRGHLRRLSHRDEQLVVASNPTVRQRV
jgi:hypothetical protein